MEGLGKLLPILFLSVSYLMVQLCTNLKPRRKLHRFLQHPQEPNETLAASKRSQKIHG